MAAQSRMVQTKKLTRLGQLVAGVAHQINNPLAFLSNNVAVFERDLIALIGLYRWSTEAGCRTGASDNTTTWTKASRAMGFFEYLSASSRHLGESLMIRARGSTPSASVVAST